MMPRTQMLAGSSSHVSPCQLSVKYLKCTMAYVPGYVHDVFVSYAHGDDWPWISSCSRRLQEALKRRLSSSASVWIDSEDLRKTADFESAIPHALKSSAVFLRLSSPAYIQSEYCVEKECRAF